MTNITLSYFNFPVGRGEECRLALHLAGVEFNDDRISFDDWSSRKPTMPFGAVPVLKIEGKPDLAQSNAILGLIGQQHDLLPEDKFEAALHIAILNYVEEISMRMGETIQMAEDQKEKARHELINGFLKEWASYIDEQIKGPYVNGDKISVADIKLFVLVSMFKQKILDYIPDNYFDTNVKLMELYNAVGTHPKIVEWYALSNN